MAQDVNLAVRIATVLDAAGLNKADKSVKGFDKSLKSLGKTHHYPESLELPLCCL